MRFRQRDILELAVNPRRARPELFPQPFPLVEQLPGGLIHLLALFGMRDFGGVETIAAPLRFRRQAIEKGRDCLNGPLTGPESVELRMPGVSRGSTFQDFLRKQGFPPSCH